MKWPQANLQTILQVLGVVILLAGLGSAGLLYQRAGNMPGGVLGYEEGNGSLYPVMPEDSKQYLRDLELYGGKANVLADKFRRWFIGLWQGKSLAIIIAGITIIISFGLFYLANHLTNFSKSDPDSENFQNSIK